MVSFVLRTAVAATRPAPPKCFGKVRQARCFGDATAGLVPMALEPGGPASAAAPPAGLVRVCLSVMSCYGSRSEAHLGE